MNEHHRTTEYDEIDFYTELCKMSPNETPITTLSLEDYFLQIYGSNCNHHNHIDAQTIERLSDLPKLKSSLQQRDMLELAFRDCGCEIPKGLADLPVTWAEAIVAFIHETEWALFPATSPKAVLGWQSVRSVRGFLEITFASPIPHSDYDWDQTAPLLLKLHQRIETANWRQLES